MKLLHIAEDFYPIKAGGAIVDTEVAETAVKQDFDVTVFTLQLGDFPRRETHNGVEIRRPVRPLFINHPEGTPLNVLGRIMAVFVFSLYVIRYSVTHPVDIIYSTNHSVHPVSKAVATLTGSPLVTFVGYSPSQYAGKRRYTNPQYLLEQINFRYYLGENIHCRDPEVRDAISKLNPDSTVRIVHGILNREEMMDALDGLTPDQELPIRDFDVASDSTVLLFVGSLTRIKRPESAVRVVSELPEPYELVVIGDGERKGAAEDVAREKGVSDRVNFVGELPHVRTLQMMLLAEGLLMTSVTESYSAVVLEALACSSHVFSTSVGIVPQIVDETERLSVCTVESMPNAILEAGELRSPVAIDEHILDAFPINRLTKTVCESFREVSQSA